MQDYGAPVGYRIASKHPDAIEAIVVQNGNAYTEGIGEAFNPMKPFWKERTAATEAAGSKSADKRDDDLPIHARCERCGPDQSRCVYLRSVSFSTGPGNDAIQLNLLYDYQSNVGLYEQWHEYFRTKQPRMLIVWGMNDPFFTVEGAKAYQRDLPQCGNAPHRYWPFRARRFGRLHCGTDEAVFP